MTPERYASYRAALALLDEAKPFALPSAEREVLRDCAEGLLLCREASGAGAECSDLIGRAALSLARTVMEDRWSNDAADSAWLLLRRCGPDSESVLESGGPASHLGTLGGGAREHEHLA